MRTMSVSQRESSSGSRRLLVRGLVGLDEMVPVVSRRRPVRFPQKRALVCWSHGLCKLVRYNEDINIIHKRLVNSSRKYHTKLGLAIETKHLFFESSR